MFVQNAVEGALIAVAVVGIIALCVWRCVRVVIFFVFFIFCGWRT